MKQFYVLPVLTLILAALFVGNSHYLGVWLQSGGSNLGEKVTITVIYPAEKLGNSKFYIRGDNCGLNNWNTSKLLGSVSTNQWQIELYCLTDLQFKILKDDKTWQIGANMMIDLQKGNSYTIYPYFYKAAGFLKKIQNFRSDILNNTRDIITYFPPGFSENYHKIYDNVLIMHDGQNLFERSTAFMGNAWMCQDTLDPLINFGQIEEVLVVGVDNTNARMTEYTYSYDDEEGRGGDGDKYLDFLEQELIPALAEQYPINSKFPRRIGILGSSLGGLISCYAGWTRSSIYSKAGCLSSSFFWNNEDFANVILRKKSAHPVQIYLDSGDSGASQDNMAVTITVKDRLVSKYNYEQDDNLFYYLDKGAEHNEYYWGKRFDKPMTFMFPPTSLEPDW